MKKHREKSTIYTKCFSCFVHFVFNYFDTFKSILSSKLLVFDQEDHLWLGTFFPLYKQASSHSFMIRVVVGLVRDFTKVQLTTAHLYIHTWENKTQNTDGIKQLSLINYLEVINQSISGYRIRYNENKLGLLGHWPKNEQPNEIFDTLYLQ